MNNSFQELDRSADGLTRRRFIVSVTAGAAVVAVPGFRAARVLAASGAALSTTDAVYESLGGMIKFLASSPGFEARLRAMDQTFQMRLVDPAATITARFTKTLPMTVEFGSSKLPVDTTIDMTSADASRFVLGELDPVLAVDQGRMKIQGKVKDFLAIVPQMRQVASPIYRWRSDDNKVPLEDLAGRPGVAIDHGSDDRT